MGNGCGRRDMVMFMCEYRVVEMEAYSLPFRSQM